MVRFGALLDMSNYDAIKQMTLELERLGFDSAWVYDHVVISLGSNYPLKKPPRSAMAAPILECWTVLSSLATQTRRIRLGTLTLNNLFRYPSILAKMSSTFDIISGGRLEFGIGTGYWRPEHEMYGIPLPSLSIRTEQLAEAIQIIKSMWTEETTEFKGKYYTVREAINNPKPVQKPHPPILIGGRSRKLMKVAAEFADHWNVPFAASISPQEFGEMVHVFDQYCLEVGRSPKDVVKSLGIRCIIDKDIEKVKDKARMCKSKWESMESFMKRLIGTPEQCIEKLNAYKDNGAEYFVIQFLDVTDFKSIQLFTELVMPAVK